MMKKSWSKISEEFLSFYEEDEALSDSSEKFLQSIDFIDDSGELTEEGSTYLDCKYIFDEVERSQKLLRRKVLNLENILTLCQSFYGQKTQREKIERFLKSRSSVSNTREAGRILGLLNDIDIVSYNKRKGEVQFKEVDQVESESQETYSISRRTPFSNIIRFRKALRSCSGDLIWIDKHFSKKGFELLAEELTGEKFDSVKILCGPSHVNLDMREDFERFQEEMEKRGIKSQVLVLGNKDTLRKIHDRWLISSEGDSWNVPPLNSVYGNQESEIHKTEEGPKYERWVKEASNLIEEWNDIQKYI